MRSPSFSYWRFRALVPLLLGAWLAACSYPDFTYRDPRRRQTTGAGAATGGTTTSTGGIGGASGGPSSVSSTGGGATTTSTTSSTGGGGGTGLPEVPCTTNGTPCSPGQVCCYSLSSSSNDHCAQPGT